MLRDVNITVEDGQLGFGNTQADGVQVKVGVSPMQGVISIIGTDDVSKIRKKLGNCPLADSVMDSIASGANQIYCLPVAASTPGTISDVSKTGEGTGTLSVTGTPTNAFTVVVEITASGAVNEAAFQYSLDGGENYSDEYTIPLNGSYALNDIGLTLSFATGDVTYEMGNTYSFTTTAPKASNADILTALDTLKTWNTEAELVHIVGESSASLWSAISTFQRELTNTYKNPMLFLMEASAPGSEENLSDYVSKLIADSKKVINSDVAVVSARGVYTKMTGQEVEENLAGVIAGLIAKSSVQESIGQTAKYGISTEYIQKLTPNGIDEYIADLDAAGFITLRSYIGLTGFYVTNARVLCDSKSDYRYVEDSRVVNKIRRELRKAALPLLQKDIDCSNTQNELEKMGEFLKVPLDSMVTAKEISSYTLSIPENQDVIVNESMDVVVRYVSRGIIREINISLARTH